MGNVIVHATISLDGFMAGSNDEMDWVFEFSGDTMASEVMGEIGAILVGRRTFEAAVRNHQLPYGGTVKVPQFVVTKEAQVTRTIDGLTFTFVSDGLQHAVDLAKAAAGDKNVAVLGASIDQQLLKARLADEIVIHVAPVLLGEGIRLFDHLGSQAIELKRTEAVATGDITSLRFAVVK